MWPNPQFLADLVTFTEEILTFCIVSYKSVQNTYQIIRPHRLTFIFKPTVLVLLSMFFKPKKPKVQRNPKSPLFLIIVY